MTEVRFTETAHDQLTDLESEIQDRIKDKLREARADPWQYLERLRGYDYYKVRVGDYRALIDVDAGADIIWVFAVGHRRNIYDRNLPP